MTLRCPWGLAYDQRTNTCGTSAPSAHSIRRAADPHQRTIGHSTNQLQWNTFTNALLAQDLNTSTASTETFHSPLLNAIHNFTLPPQTINENVAFKMHPRVNETNIFFNRNRAGTSHSSLESSRPIANDLTISKLVNWENDVKRKNLAAIQQPLTTDVSLGSVRWQPPQRKEELPQFFGGLTQTATAVKEKPKAWVLSVL